MKQAVGSCEKLADIEWPLILDIQVFEKDKNVATITLTRQSFKAYSNLISVPKIHSCKLLLLIFPGGGTLRGQHEHTGPRFFLSIRRERCWAFRSLASLADFENSGN